MRKLWMIGLLAALSACGKDPVPTGVKIGKPYVIDGKTYYPEYDSTYDKIGDASWYGPGFHGKRTANGERFNQNDLTAAHPTLPMPSLVRVTNLENGKSAIIRINDRGPFKKNRIIDLSKASAERLGAHSIHRVRVQFLKNETEKYLAELQETGKQVDMWALNNAEQDRKDNVMLAATEPSNDIEIIEETNADSQPGDMVDSAAPILSVSADDAKEAPAPKKFSLVRQAMAEDDVPSPRATSSGASASTRPVELIHSDDLPPLEAEAKPVAPASAPQTLAAPTAQPSAPVITSAAPMPAGGAYAIQAGSFAAEANALKLKGQLQGISAMKIDAFVDRVEMNGKQWWRVRAGPFADKDTADRALDLIRANLVPEARIVHQ